MLSKACRFWLPLGFGIFLASCGTPIDPPRLVIVIAVDQMRADYLDRFAEHSEGGFRRLREHGAVFTDAHQDHAFTQTAPGHATIATGVFPSRHGVVANEFYDRPGRQVAGAGSTPPSRTPKQLPP